MAKPPPHSTPAIAYAYAVAWLLGGIVLAVIVAMTEETYEGGMMILVPLMFMTLGGAFGSLLGNSIRGAIVGALLLVAMWAAGALLFLGMFLYEWLTGYSI